MAKSKFINYIAYENLYNANSVVNCSINPNKGQIKFRHHFTKNAKIQFILNFDDRGQLHQEAKEDSSGGNTNITKDGNNVYTFSAKNFPADQRDLQNFQTLQIRFSEGSYDTLIILGNTDKILENALKEQDDNNIFFRFSYNVNDANCKQFDNCILYIEQDDSSNYTYTKWISPIASGNDIKSYIKGTTVFVGDLKKCIKATSSSTWTSAFRKSIRYENYNGNIKTNPSKDYVDKNLVRFQDIDLTSITTSITSIPVNPGTPVTPKA